MVAQRSINKEQPKGRRLTPLFLDIHPVIALIKLQSNCPPNLLWFSYSPLTVIHHLVRLSLSTCSLSACHRFIKPRPKKWNTNHLMAVCTLQTRSWVNFLPYSSTGKYPPFTLQEDNSTSGYHTLMRKACKHNEIQRLHKTIRVTVPLS